MTPTSVQSTVTFTLKKMPTDKISLCIILLHQDGLLILLLLVVGRGCIYVYSDYGRPQNIEEVELKNDPCIKGKKL